jgi:hypothetical protein
MALKSIYIVITCYFFCQNLLLATSENEAAEVLASSYRTGSITAFCSNETNNETSLIQGFQPHYKTRVKEEEWQQVLCMLHMLNHPLLNSSPERRDAIVKKYQYTFDNYYALYKQMEKGERKCFKQLEKKHALFFNPLFQFVAGFEDAYDNIRSQYGGNSQQRKQLEDEIFPIVQRTFNRYMTVYEKLKNLTTATLESLDYSSIQSSSSTLKHLYYKRDDNGFLLFTLYPHKILKDGYYESYIPYKFPTAEIGEHSIIFRKEDDSEKLKVVHEPGLIIDRKGDNVFLSYYTGSLSSYPYTAKPETWCLKGKSSQAWINSLIVADKLKHMAAEEREAGKASEIYEVFADALTQVLGDSVPPGLDQEGATLKIEENLHVILPEEQFLNFAEGFLGKYESGFIPFPRTSLDQIECDYLWLLECRERIRSYRPSAADVYLLEYLTEEPFSETDIETHLGDTLRKYEEDILEGYSREEEVYRLEQEQRQDMVRRGEHYKKKAPTHSKGKKQIKRQGKLQSKKQHEHQTPPLKNKYEAGTRERLQQLKNGNRGLKFRNYMKMVNAITREIVKEGVEITGQLNKSSHGKFKAEGSTPISVVRPHGRYNTVSPKGAKKSLNSLMNAYFSHKNEK